MSATTSRCGSRKQHRLINSSFLEPWKLLQNSELSHAELKTIFQDDLASTIFHQQQENSIYDIFTQQLSSDIATQLLDISEEQVSFLFCFVFF